MTLQARVARPERNTGESPWVLRAAEQSDVPVLGSLYFQAYEAGLAGADVVQATSDIQDSFDGAYGPLWAEASPVAELGGAMIGALLTVERPPWDDVADHPFVIELFVHRSYRRKGVARSLLHRCLEVLAAGDETRLGLRVTDDNFPALALYEGFGFAPAESPGRTRE